jgi:hypothetical protein
MKTVNRNSPKNLLIRLLFILTLAFVLNKFVLSNWDYIKQLISNLF